MGGGKIELHISSLHNLHIIRCKIIKKIARTQYVHAKIYLLQKGRHKFLLIVDFVSQFFYIPPIFIHYTNSLLTTD